MEETKRPPLVLLILDGWGIAPASDGNPITAANLPTFNQIIRNYPTVPIQAAGEAVGTNWGEQGNSEVGHLTIGSGRVFYQSLPRINLSIQDGSFFRNPRLLDAALHVKKRKSTLHIIGIVGPGNIHGADEHLYALLKLARQQRLTKVMVHAILDGRDTGFNAGIGFIRALQEKMRELRVGRIASVSGRYYAMDRDNRWERIELAYRAMTGTGNSTADDPIAAIDRSYAAKVYDEEFIPVMLTDDGHPVGPIKDGDAVIFSNFRPDRASQLTTAFVLPSFLKFERQPMRDLFFVTMTEYQKGLPTEVAFPPEVIKTCLAKIISDRGLKQLHVAETEKYAHVTFFLNGMQSDPFPGEDRVIIPSPHVASYDQKPEMSAEAITDCILGAVTGATHEFIVANFANADMVGHTGEFEATKKAVEEVDRCLGRIIPAVLEKNGIVIITADHGNAEELKNIETGAIDKEHSSNAVPFIVVDKRLRGIMPPSGEFVSDMVINGDISLIPPVGMLTDVAPTVLKMMGIPQPSEMTGNILI